MTIIKDTCRPFINKIVALLVLTYVQKVVMVCYTFSFVGGHFNRGEHLGQKLQSFFDIKKKLGRTPVCVTVILFVRMRSHLLLR